MDAATLAAWQASSFGRIHAKAETVKARKRLEAADRRQRQGKHWRRAYAPPGDTTTISRPTENAALRAIYEYSQPSIWRVTKRQVRGELIYIDGWHNVDLGAPRICVDCLRRLPTYQFCDGRRISSVCKECRAKRGRYYARR